MLNNLNNLINKRCIYHILLFRKIITSLFTKKKKNFNQNSLKIYKK